MAELWTRTDLGRLCILVVIPARSGAYEFFSPAVALMVGRIEPAWVATQGSVVVVVVWRQPAPFECRLSRLEACHVFVSVSDVG